MFCVVDLTRCFEPPETEMVLMQHSRTLEDNERGGNDKRLQLNQISHLKWLVLSWPKCTTSPYPFTFLSIWTTGWCEGVISSPPIDSVIWKIHNFHCSVNNHVTKLWSEIHSIQLYSHCPTYQEWWTSSSNVHHYQFWTNYSSVFFFGAELSPLGNQKKKHQMGMQKNPV